MGSPVQVERRTFRLRYPADVIRRTACAHQALRLGCRACSVSAHAYNAVESGELVLRRGWGEEPGEVVLSGEVLGPEGFAALVRMVAVAREDPDPVHLAGWPYSVAETGTEGPPRGS